VSAEPATGGVEGGEAEGGAARSGGEPQIEVLANPDAVAAAAAQRIAAALSDAVGQRGRADWATTGGSTPVGIYRELSGASKRDEVPWGHVHVWWGDDRFVPRDHPLSNVLPFDQVLLRAAAFTGASGDGESGIDVEVGTEPGVLVPGANIHAMPMTAAIAEGKDSAWVAAAYEAELRAAALPESDGIPVFDIVFSGIGADGHILSVFPGSRVFDETGTPWVAGIPAPEHVEPHVARVSLHPAFLAAARLVLVVAFGAGKADVLADVLGGTRDPSRWPSQHARRPNAVWLLDEAAAAKLAH
jgi:6-phosphogluconolactonase